MPNMTPVTNLMTAHAKMRLAGLDNVADRMIYLVADHGDARWSTADMLTLVNTLGNEFVAHRETIMNMFTQPF